MIICENLFNPLFCLQEVSIFVFEKKSAEKLHKPRRKETIAEILRSSVRQLERFRHPKILQVINISFSLSIFFVSLYSSRENSQFLSILISSQPTTYENLNFLLGLFEIKTNFPNRLVHSGRASSTQNFVVTLHSLFSQFPCNSFMQVVYPLEEGPDTLSFAAEPVFSSLANLLTSSPHHSTNSCIDVNEKSAGVDLHPVFLDVELRYGILQASINEQFVPPELIAIYLVIRAVGSFWSWLYNFLRHFIPILSHSLIQQVQDFAIRSMMNYMKAVGSTFFPITNWAWIRVTN